MKTWTSLLATGLLLTGLALANLPAPGGNHPPAAERELKQEKRIERGVRSRQLTAREANRLHRQQARLRAEEGR